MSGAMPYFGDAYMADTRHLSLEEHGAYHLLLLIAWRSPNCALPNDDKRIAQMLGITPKKWASIRPSIIAFWTATKNGWEQKRLTKERRWVDEKSRKNSAAADAKWNAKRLETKEAGNANASANGCANAHANGYPPPPLPPEEESPNGDRPSGDGHTLTIEKVFEGYQDLADGLGLPVPRDLTPERRQLIRGRIKQYPLDDFLTVFGKCRDSPFLRGDRGRTPLTIDWLMKKGNFQKALEGNYD